MSIVPVNIRLTTNGTEQNVVLNKQLINVQHVYLSEVLAVGFNGGVAAGVIIRVKHPQLNNVPIHDRPQDGTMVLINPLTPQMTYQDKLMLRGEIANINSFLISVQMLNGAVATFTELYLVLKVICRLDPQDRLANAMADIPQIKGADPRQMKFL